MSKTASSGSGFVLPKLGNLPTSSAVSPSLSDFANSQLKPDDSTNKKNQFTIPKLFPSKDVLVPVEDMQKLQLKSQPQPILIDLKSALVSETEQKKISQVPKKEVKKDIENFIPQFVDCDFMMDVSVKEFIFDERCERPTLTELRKRYKKLMFKEFSIVGKIIRQKFKKKIPKIRHGYEPKHIIERFTFDTPSPDDKILAHLSKIKK